VWRPATVDAAHPPPRVGAVVDLVVGVGSSRHIVTASVEDRSHVKATEGPREE
jgi:hypothetical protein